ncbi:MAG: slipin family protein [Nitrospirae bacterium]|nr:slipin family protein [Nitrospirota bacterium]MBI5694551.1 slipin family protein [Nitrospirota bacterium]
MGLGIAVLIIFVIISNTIKILKEYERGVIFTLGRVEMEGGVKGPGLIILLPVIQKMARVSLRTVTMDVPSQDVITKDNVTVKVNAVVYFRVMDARRAVIEVEDFYYATSQIAQTTLRSVLGQSTLDDLLGKRDEINIELQKIIDLQTEPWGVKVTVVEVKNVDLPESMQRAIARQAEAERERRAKVISAEGEYQAAQKLADAAKIIQTEPAALQLRYLQSMLAMGGDKNTTTIFPIPIDLIKPFMKAYRDSGE